MTTDPGISVRVEGVTKSFGDVSAVNDVSLAIADGAFVSLLGPSGCGKTTLLRIIAGFERPDTGRILVHGQDITSLPPEKRPMNLVFQRGALFPHMTVAKNVGYSLRTRGVGREEIAARVNDALALVRLPGMAERMPSQLSGGQAQRVALARALVGEPSVLLLDEPLAALDLKLRKEMQLELRRIQQTLGRTFLYVTHDQEEALVMSDRIVVMSDGRFVEDGTPEQVYSRPTSLFASSFIGETNQMPGELTLVTGRVGKVLLDGGLTATGTLSSGPVTVGSPVMITLRPEHVSIARPGATQPSGCHASPAHVIEVVYVGSRTRVKCRIANGIELWAEVAPSSAPSPGDEIELQWPESDALILAR